MPPAYTAQQKTAIVNFTSITGTDRTSAARILKAHSWNVESAINGYYSGSIAPATNPHAPSLNKIFDKYRDAPSDSPDNINTEGMMEFLEAIKVPVEDIGMLIVSEIVKSPSMGEIARDGFVQGWTIANIGDLKSMAAFVSRRRESLSNELSTFRRIYKHSFFVAKPPNQKSAPLESALEFWKVLFQSPGLEWRSANTPWLDYWLEFLEAKWKKSVNKDMWDQTLAFAEKTLLDESLSWWDENGAWPGVVDDFVEWVKERRGDAKEEMDLDY
ncbi:DUF298-domain-containing protein [Patellaria atrata CBS 101060]|uniref:Defective in cullin neddylation protein n=1 Tax=Patellaria atrata CBS 101060 TaxID=1346257 RepID=A0A9P4S8W7_9PEZI|nr:DUF298-domain-containing protein [Patellaria atrata CBS 101060]